MEKKMFLFVIVVFLFVSLTSFSVSKRINVAVRLNTSEYSDTLKLEFNMTYPQNKNRSIYGGTIEIFRNDSLYLRLALDSLKPVISSWHFPSLPNGYKIVYPEHTDSIPYFSKIGKLKFLFRSHSYVNYFGVWEYNPFYSDEKAKWLFDEFGNHKIEIKSEYEPWLIGKDIIKIKMDENFSIENSKLQLFDDNNNAIGFEIKYKKNPTNVVALKLKNKAKKGQKIRLSIDFGDERYYEDEVIVPNRSIVGIVGKYNDL